MGKLLAVAIHDVEPRSFASAREIRSWLENRGVGLVTLLVIPAADLHPIGVRAPDLAAWLRHRVARGDAVAQHGLVHRAAATPPWPRSLLATWQGGSAAEFPGLAPEDAARRVATGRRLLCEIELEPRGFVAPGYAYTRALRGILAESHEWFADIGAVRSPVGDVHARALCLGSSTKLKRALSPAIVRTTARTTGDLMRIDIHPADFSVPSHISTLEILLDRAQGRTAVTYDDICSRRRLGPRGVGHAELSEGATVGAGSMPVA